LHYQKQDIFLQFIGVNPTITKTALYGRFLLWLEIKTARTSEGWFDYKRKADGSMPVGDADERRGNSNEVQSSPVIPTILNACCINKRFLFVFQHLCEFEIKICNLIVLKSSFELIYYFLHEFLSYLSLR